jgi:Spy/CpxP family protein refolding chaperone
MLKMRVERLTEQLELTAAQVTKATSIYSDAQTASQAIQSSMQTNRQSLAEAVKKNDTAAIDRLSVTAGTLSGQITAIDSKAEAAFYAILTASQQAKYDTMPRRGPGGPGGPMGPQGFGPPRR